ncbi:MAG: twin arginine-targeting protein translocase TatC [Chloroflexi bacterium RBG_16_48_7]|nr:MAG: twin arginine-targeting protein translocase TatC [Chloroflexi bacterium RBG_16_48_7]
MTEKRITILSHLLELRNRLLRSVIAVAITSSFSFIFADNIFKFLILPVEGTKFVFIDMTEMLGIYMKVCITAGIMLAMPYLLYQLLMFVTPALTPKEKRGVYFILPMIIIMFLAGVAFSYYVLIPPAANFLITFGNEIAVPQIRITSYISLVTRLLIATGIVFELPVISTFLARLGIITPEWLSHKRKVAFIGAFVLGAIITPTFDPVNQTLIAAPLIVLYEISILLAKVFRKKQPCVAEALVTPGTT